MLKSALAYLLIALATPAFAQQPLPDPSRTPGAINPEVRQDNISSTICVRGWTRSVRPAEQYTSALKREQLREFGYRDRRMSDFEEDHLIPLALGGHPYDRRNLWPEPRSTQSGWNADLKDDLEATLSRMVCSRRLSLAEAQQAIASNWIDAYNRFVVGE